MPEVGIIQNLKPYLEYQKLEDAWFGEVPTHWRVLPNRAIFTEVKERNHPNAEMLSITITQGVIRQRKLLSGSSKKDSSNIDKSAYKLVCPGDIAYNKMRAWQGALGASDLRGIISPAYVVMRSREQQNTRYFHYLFRTPHFTKEAERWSYGITSDMWSLRPEHFKLIYTPIPSLDEQTAIVHFLDYTNRRLNKAIRAKRKLITLLNEQKQAIIHRAVTCGLDPNVPLKDSGIPWLGEIPAHWESKRLKHCITPIKQGWSSQCDAQPATENEWGVLKVGCVNKDFFNSYQNKKLPKTLFPDPTLEIHDGDILVSRANTSELLGLAALAESPRPKLMLSDKLFRFQSVSTEFNSRYLVFALRCKLSRVQIESSTNGASDSMQNIGQGVIKNLWVAVPPVSEQEQIVAYITQETKPIETIITRTEREITLLREYKTRLTADVVTGKLDVREAARHLPEKSDETDEAGAMVEAKDDLEDFGLEGVDDMETDA